MSNLLQSNSTSVLSAPTIKASLILKHGNAAEWTSVNPMLLKGELGVEIDTGLLKVGDGVKLYADLPYLNVTPAQLTAFIQKPETYAENNIPIFDENGNLIDSGVTIGEYSGGQIPASETTLGMVLSSKEDNSISVNETGKMSLNRVSVSNLYVPEEEELVLSSGNSN